MGLRDHTHWTYHTVYDSSGRVISPTQKPLSDNPQHSEADIRVPRLDSNPQTPASERPQTHALENSASGIGTLCNVPSANKHTLSTIKDYSGQRIDATFPATTELEFQRWTSLAADRLHDVTSRKTAVFIATFVSNILISLHI